MHLALRNFPLRLHLPSAIVVPMKKIRFCRIFTVVLLSALAISCHFRIYGQDPPGKVTFTIDVTTSARLSCDIYYDGKLGSTSTYAMEKFDSNKFLPDGTTPNPAYLVPIVYTHYSTWQLLLTGPATIRIISYEGHFDNDPASSTYGSLVQSLPATAALILYENDSPVASGIGQVEYRF